MDLDCPTGASAINKSVIFQAYIPSNAKHVTYFTISQIHLITNEGDKWFKGIMVGSTNVNVQYYVSIVRWFIDKAA